MKLHPYLLLAGIMVVGIALRIYQLGFQPIACDELYTLDISRMGFIEGFLYVMVNDTNPPLYYLFTHLFYPGIRYASVLFGILTIPVIYFLGKEYRDIQMGLLSAGIVAILYPMIYYSQYARAYAMMTFVMILFFIQFLRIRHNKNAPSSDYYLLGIVAAIALWTHLYAIFPILVTFLILSTTTARTNALKASLPVIISLVALIPLFLSTIETRKEEYGNFPGIPAQDLLYFIPIEFFNIGIFVIVPLILLGLYFTKTDRVSLELTGIVIGSALLGISVSFVTQVFPRYFLPLLPICVLFACIGLLGLLDRMKPWAKPIVITMFFLLLALTQYGSLLALYTVVRLSC
jgi:mannosyltransferase